MSRFKQTERAIARRLEGTHGPKKYAGEDNVYTKREAEESAKAIAAAAGRKKFGKARFQRMAAAGRRRALRRH